MVPWGRLTFRGDHLVASLSSGSGKLQQPTPTATKLWFVVAPAGGVGCRLCWLHVVLVALCFGRIADGIAVADE